MKISIRAESNYVEKKIEESGNITYIYSDKHIKARNKKKEKRIKTLAKSIKDLRSQVKKDMKDEELKNIATVVALIDETYERVGNPASAGEDHFGVTTWRKKHVTFSGSTAKIKYKGKGGVDQEKTVTSSPVVSELKAVCKNIKKNDELFPDVSAGKVNEYLKSYKITAKDIRGLHANEEMRKALKKAKSSETDTEKKRKEEFKDALEETAKLVGHTANTLKNQYLVPSIEVNYMKSGKISQGGMNMSFPLSIRASAFVSINPDPERMDDSLGDRYNWAKLTEKEMCKRLIEKRRKRGLSECPMEEIYDLRRRRHPGRLRGREERLRGKKREECLQRLELYEPEGSLDNVFPPKLFKFRGLEYEFEKTNRTETIILSTNRGSRNATIRIVHWSGENVDEKQKGFTTLSVYANMLPGTNPYEAIVSKQYSSLEEAEEDLPAIMKLVESVRKL